jgi:hypothetical protein
MSQGILSGRDDRSKVFRHGNPHFRRLRLVLDLLAGIILCSVDKTLAEELLQFCINGNTMIKKLF